MAKVKRSKAWAELPSRLPRLRIPLKAVGGGADFGALGRQIGSAARDVIAARQRIEQGEAVKYADAQTAGVEAELTRRFLALQEEAVGDSDGFTQRVDDAFREVTAPILKAAPSDAAREVTQQRFGQIQSDLTNRALEFETVNRRAERIASHRTSLDQFATAAFNTPERFRVLLREALGGIAAAEATDLTPAVARELRALAPGLIAEGAVRGFIARDPERTLEALRPGSGDALADMLTVTARARLANVAEGAVKDLEGEREAQAAAREAAAKEAAARRNAALEIAISRGEKGHQAIAEADARGDLSPAKLVQLTKAADKRREEQLKEAVAVRLVALALDGTASLDPHSPDDRQALDAFFRRYAAEELADTPPDKAFQRILEEIIVPAGMVPDAVKGRINGALRAEDPATVAAAAELVSQIDRLRPAALKGLGEDERSFGLTVATELERLGPGEGAAQAVRRARTAIFDADDPERVRRRKRFHEEKVLSLGREAFVGALKSRDGRFNLITDVEITDALQGEFDEILEQEFLRSGVLEGALASALSRITARWDVTAIDGAPRWMRDPPEREYAVAGQPPDWMGEQLLADLSENALLDRSLEGRIRLFNHGDVNREDGRPVYEVWLLDDETGVFEPVVNLKAKDGRYRWQPRWEESARFRELRKEREEERALLRTRQKRASEPRGRKRSRKRSRPVPGEDTAPGAVN